MKIRTWLTTLALASAVVLAPAIASADITHYEVSIDGLACPFCVRGVRKHLEALDGARNVQVDLASHRATLDVAASIYLAPDAVRGAIRQAGFTPREQTLSAEGEATLAGELVRLAVDKDHTIEIRAGAAFADLKKLLGSGKTRVAVTGTVTDPGRAVVDVATVRAVASS